MKKFTKSDLKDGMVVEYRNREYRVVWGEQLVGLYKNNVLSNYDEDLNYCSGLKNFDIVAIYSMPEKFIFMHLKSNILAKNRLKLIWDRDTHLESVVNELSKAEETVKRCKEILKYIDPEVVKELINKNPSNPDTVNEEPHRLKPVRPTRRPIIGDYVESLVEVHGGCYEPHSILQKGEISKVVEIHKGYILVDEYDGFKLRDGGYRVCDNKGEGLED